MYRQHGTFAKIGIYFYTSKLFGVKMWKIIVHKPCEKGRRG